MNDQEPVAGADDLNWLLDRLRQAGQKPDRALLDQVKAHGQAAVRPLLAMAVDESLLDAPSDSPEGWAPLRAIELLGELGAPEAVEPLLPLFDRVDDDYLAETLPEAYGGLGAPAVAPLRALLFDRTRDVFARARAAGSLGQIGQKHPETRSEVVDALVARLDPVESQTPDDEILNGFVIAALLDVRAVEAAPAVRRAFDEDRVDTSIVDLDHALEELGLPGEPRPARPGEEEGLRLRLRCTACGHERDHYVRTIYCDLATQERRQRGEETSYSEFIIPQRITCPKCGTVDQYELSSMAYIALTAEMLKAMAAHKAGRSVDASGEGHLQFVRFHLADGREMHPLAAREMYRQQIEVEPDSADLRARYGNVLRLLGYREEAVEQYQAALRLEPASLEAYLNLGQLAIEAGDRAEARRMLESIIAQAPRSRLSRKDRETYVATAAAELAALTPPPERSSAVRPALWGATDSRALRAEASGQPTRVVRKVGRNEPCPCGSGKKYKKCHGR